MAYTEFYVRTGGSNLNAGSSNIDPAAFTYAGGTFVRATGVFTVASGNPSGDGVAVGDFASIYTTAGATVATFIGRVTARDTTTITVSLTAIAGATSSVSEAANAATCKIGGAWAGPSGAVNFPFGFATTTMNDGTSLVPRVNFVGNATWSISATIAHGVVGPIIFEGCNSSPGDGGYCNISASNTTGYGFNCSGGGATFVGFRLTSTAATGVTSGFYLQNAGPYTVRRCAATDFGGYGFTCSSVGVLLIECEVCNCSRRGAYAGFSLSASVAINCIAHDCTGNSSSVGFSIAGTSSIIGCISDTNYNGLYIILANLSCAVIGCDIYNSTGYGAAVIVGNKANVVIRNSNFLKNGTYGITHSGSTVSPVIFLDNCGFGTGTQANSSGNFSSLISANLIESGHVDYASGVTPWTDPADGDFRISLAEAKGTGRGAYLQTQSGYGDPNPTVAYPDIGAAQHQETGGSGSGPSGSFSFM